MPYGVLLLPYEEDDGRLVFAEPVLIPRAETGDRQLTTRLAELLDDGAGERELTAFLLGSDAELAPAAAHQIAVRILGEGISIGRLGLSDARQWRVRYGQALADISRRRGFAPGLPPPRVRHE